MPIYRFWSLVSLLQHLEEERGYANVRLERRGMELMVVGISKDGTVVSALVEQQATTREVEDGYWIVKLPDAR
jgi:hypothetical protein